MRMLHGQARQQLTDPLELHFMHLLMAVEVGVRYLEKGIYLSF